MEHLLAQTLRINGQEVKGPLQGFGSGGNITLADVINRVLTVFIIPLAFVLLFVIFIWGGFDFLMSQGNPEKVKSGRAKITAGIIGLILLLVAYVVVKLFSYVFGLGQGIL